jgi:hypothetical protein
MLPVLSLPGCGEGARPGRKIPPPVKDEEEVAEAAIIMLLPPPPTVPWET